MGYEGDELVYCDIFDFSETWVVVVTGDAPNIYGHMLLNTGGKTGFYFQVIGSLWARPRFMSEAGYRRYLRENGKSELGRVRVNVPNPDAATVKLENVLNNRWTWGVVIHNCETLVEDIIVAGGGPKLHKHWYALPIPTLLELLRLPNL